MDACQIKDSLNKRIAFLYGGRDRDGSPVMLFPPQGDFIDHPQTEVANVISYLARIPDDFEFNRRICVIVDMRHGWIRYLKTVLKAVQQVLNGRVKYAIIIKPDGFIERQRIHIDLKLEVYGFKTVFLSLPKLGRYVDSTCLPACLDGTFPYDHRRFVERRIKFEAFARQASVLLRELELLGHELEYHRPDKDHSSASSRRSSIQAMSFLITEDFTQKLSQTLDRGHQLEMELKEDDHTPNVLTASNPDLKATIRRTELLNDELKVKAARILNTSTKHAREHSDLLLFDQLCQGVDNLDDWLIGAGEKWLLSLHEIGESKDEAEQLLRDYEKLLAKAQKIQDQANDLRSIAQQLLEAEHSSSNEIRKKWEFLDNISKTFDGRVKHQHEVIELSVKCHQLMDEFRQKMDEMLEKLCSEILVHDVQSSEASLHALDVQIESIDRAYGEIMIEGQILLELMSIPEQKSDGSGIATDYISGIIYMRRRLEELTDRKERCSELADVRRLKLQQMLQLHICERDAEQAVKWIDELSEALGQQHSRIGSTEDEVKGLRNDISTLESTARSTFDYGKQLVQASNVLRRSCRIPLSAAERLMLRLDECWANFCKALSERTTRLNVSMAFFTTLDQVNRRLEDLCRQVGTELLQQKQLKRHSYSGQNGILEIDCAASRARRPPDQLRRQLLTDIKELRHLADVLLQRLDASPREPGLNSEYLSEETSASSIIRSRLAEVDSKHRRLENYWNEEDQCLGCYEAELAAIDFQFSDPSLEIHDDELYSSNVCRHITHNVIIEHIPMLRSFDTQTSTITREWEEILREIEEDDISPISNGYHSDARDFGRKPTTTVSTIAIKAGEYTKIVLAVLKSTSWIHIRIDQMTPAMLDVGNTLEEALRLKQLHDELIIKLASKQGNIEELLGQADGLVSQQKKPEADVYEAMANSLGDAWKELNRQLQVRAHLLDQAVKFFNWAQKHSEDLDVLERNMHDRRLTDDLETAHRLLQEHMDIKRAVSDMQTSAMEVMGFGQALIGEIREAGALVDNSDRARQVSEACQKIEAIMLRLNERRRQLEELWEQRRQQLEMCIQACEVYAGLRKIESWVREKTAVIENQDLGDSDTSAEYLLREHEQIYQEALGMQEHANRLLAAANTLASQGYSEAEPLRRKALDIKRQIDELLAKLGLRRELLIASVSFFKNANSALTRMLQIEQELRSSNLPKGSEALMRRYSELAALIQETAGPPIHQGRTLLQKVGEPGGRGVRRKVEELERRLADLDAALAASKADQLAKAQKYNDFLRDFNNLDQWLRNAIEAFLNNNPDMGQTLPAVTDFLERHRQAGNELRGKEPDLSRLKSRLHDLAMDAGDPNFEDLRRKTNDLEGRFDRAGKTISNRSDLALLYQQFHKTAQILGTDMDSLEALLAALKDPEDRAAQRRVDELWHVATGNHDQLKQQGNRFLIDSKLVTSDPVLDVPRARLCVETILDHFQKRFDALGRLRQQLEDKLKRDKENRDNWEKFLADCKRLMDWLSQLHRDPALIYTRFEDPPLQVMDRQQRIVEDFMPTVRKAQSEVENQIRTAEALGSRFDTRGQKERVIEEIVKAHQRFQQLLSEFQQLTGMTVSFFRNLNQLDDFLRKVEEQFSPSRLPQDPARLDRLIQEHAALRSTVSEMIRLAANEGQQIVDRSRRGEFSPEVKRECDKIPGLVEQRNRKWEDMWAEQRRYLEQHNSLARFDEEYRQIVEGIARRSEQLARMQANIGNSKEAVAASARAFGEFMKDVDKMDRRVRDFLNMAEVMLAGPFKDNVRVRQKADDVRDKWNSFRAHLDDYRNKLALAQQFFDLYEELEQWCNETIEYIRNTARKATECRTSDEANNLMGQLEARIKPQLPITEGKIGNLDGIARPLYAEHADNQTAPIKRRYKEIVDSLHALNDQLFTLAESLREKEAKAREPPPVPPHFTQPLRDAQVVEGSRFEFVARVSGYPVPEVTWFKDGMRIVNNPDYETSFVNGTCVLKIEETFTEDSATFTCRATNIAGQAETAARLTVKEHMQPPEFLRKLENAVVTEGDRFGFECQVGGNPPPTVAWYKNEQPIENLPGYSTSFSNGVCRLTIPEVFVEDEARWSCRAANKVGDAATSAKLTVQPKPGSEPPIIIKPLENLSICPGDRLMLECFVKGSPMPTIEWKHNNIPIRDTREARCTYDGYKACLLIPEAYPNHSGTFSLLAKNRLGEATTSCQVAVRPKVPEFSDSEFEPAKPRFLLELVNVTVAEGDPARLDCAIVGSPEPEVIWFKEQVPVKESPDLQLHFEGDHCILSIPNATLADQGIYKVVARNSCGEATNFCKLTVIPRSGGQVKLAEEFYEQHTGISPSATPPEFLIPLKNVSVRLGQPARMECLLIGNPRPTITWLFNGQPIPIGHCDFYNVGDTYAVNIPRVGPEHLGTYKLIAENIRGVAESSGDLYQKREQSPEQAPLVEYRFAPPVAGPPLPQYEPPNWIRTLISAVCAVGNDVTFEGHVIGIPSPELVWYKNGVQISPSEATMSYRDGIATLTLHNAQLQDTGKITCKAMNAGGIATTSAQLLVRPTLQAPDFIQSLISKEVMEGDSLRWEVKVVGDPIPTVRWYRQDKPIVSCQDCQILDEGNGVHVLYIPKLALSDSGQFTVRAENDAGEARSTADLVVRPKGAEAGQYYHVTKVYQERQELGMELESHKTGHLHNVNRTTTALYEQTLDGMPIAFGVGKRQIGTSSGPQQPPHFVQPLQDQRVPTNARAVMECQVAGQPEPEVKWLKDGADVSNIPDLSIEQEGEYHRLVIPRVTRGETGRYTAQAYNPVGSKSSSAMLMLASAGQAASYNAFSPPPESLQRPGYLQQQRPNIQDAKRQVMSQFGAAIQQPRQPKGYYRQNQGEPHETDSSADMAWASEGEADRPLHRPEFLRRPHSGQENMPKMLPQQSQQPPKFVRVPNDVSLPERQQARFDAKVIGRPYPSVEWYKNNEPIRDSNKHKLLVNQDGVHSLMIRGTEHSDQALYTCIARNQAGEAKCSASFFLIAPQAAPEPQFIEKVQSQSAKEGESIVLHVKVSGNPIPQLRWSKDGIQLSPGQPYRIEFAEGESWLYIDNVGPEDAGWYQCDAISSLGTASSRARVSVQPPKHVQSPRRSLEMGKGLVPGELEEGEVITLRHVERARPRVRDEEMEPEIMPPRFLAGPADLPGLREGQWAHFEAQLVPVNDPNLKVIWLFNGLPMQASSRVAWLFDFGFATMDIKPVYPEDSGVYTCYAINQLGEAQVSAQMRVSGINKEANGNGGDQKVADVANQRRGSHHRFGTDSSLDDDVAASRETPVFTKPLKAAVEAIEGRAVRLDAKLTPVTDSSLRVEWLHNGKPLISGSRFRIFHDFGIVSLDISRVCLADAGKYTVLASNTRGTTETSAQLTVDEDEEEEEDVQEEQRSKLKPVKNGSHHAPISAAYSTDDEEIPAVRKPEFTSAMKDVSVTEGSVAQFQTKVEPKRDSSLAVEWYKDGKPLMLASRIRPHFDFGLASIMLHPAYPEDSGTYTCIASNKAGKAEISANLSCQGPTSAEYLAESESVHVPEIVKPLDASLSLQEGETAHFSCQVKPTRDPKMVFEWLRNGTSMPQGHRFRTLNDFGFASLEILSVCPEDNGVYCLVASNDLGSAQTECALTVTGNSSLLLDSIRPDGLQSIQQLEAVSNHVIQTEDNKATTPQIVLQLQDATDCKEGDFVRLECHVQPVDDPNLSVEWFINDQPLQLGHRFRNTLEFGVAALDILSVYPEDSGSYACVASNFVGKASSHCTIACERKEGICLESVHPESLDRIRELEAPKAQPSEKLESETIAPRFTQTLPSELLIKEGDSALLECVVEPTKDQTRSIAWLFNGVPIQQGHRFRTLNDFGFCRLELLYAYAGDSGMFSCRASNAAGTAETSCSITCLAEESLLLNAQKAESWRQIQKLEEVEALRQPSPERSFPAPSFETTLEDFDDIEEGQSIRLECRLLPIRDPSMQVVWLRNGKPLPEGHRLRPAYNFDRVSLDLLCLYPEDSGIYACQASNQTGSASVACTVKCSAKESLLLLPQQLDSWQKIQALEAKPAIESIIDEKPSVAPTFTQALPASMLPAAEGSEIHVECFVEPTQDPSLKITWLHNGRPITAANRLHFTHDFGYIALDILYAFAEDSGTWTCLATNDLGSVQCEVLVKVSGEGLVQAETVRPKSWALIQEIEAPKAMDEESPITDFPAPKFEQGLEGTVARIEGQPVHFECRITPIADPELTVQWLHNNEPLQPSNRIVSTFDFGYVALDLAYVFPEDAGTFTCVAANAAGECKTEQLLEVQEREALMLETQRPEALAKIKKLETPSVAAEPKEKRIKSKPYFEQQLNSCLDLIEGQPAHFECIIAPVRDPNLKVEWFHNDVPLEASSRFVMTNDFGYTALKISYCLPEDAGKFTVLATNKIGQAESSGELQCKARSSLYLETQHAKSLAKIKEMEAPKAAPVAPEHLVFQRPAFTQALSNVENIAEGEPALFECRLIPVKDPKLTVQWFFNDLPLQTSNRVTTTNDFGYISLTFASTHSNDSGIYICKAVNELGEATTTAVLSIIPLERLALKSEHPERYEKIQKLETVTPIQNVEDEKTFDKPTFVEMPTSLENLKDGDTAHFDCKITPANDPSLTVTWLHYGEPLEFGSRFQQQVSFGYVSLEINPVRAQDSGIYTCELRNTAGSATTFAVLKVEGYESIARETLRPGSLQKIKELEQPVLATIVAEEKRRQKPRFTTSFDEGGFKNVPEGQPVHLELHFEPTKDDTLTIEWLRDGQPLPTGQLTKIKNEVGVTTLDIANVYPEHSGLYSVKIVNSEGAASLSTTITVAGHASVLTDTIRQKSLKRIQELECPKADLPTSDEQVFEPPTFLSQLENVEVVEGSPVKFECHIDGSKDPNFRVDWLWNGKPLCSGSKYKIVSDFGLILLELAYAYPEDSGVYVCKVTNSAGDAFSSATLHCEAKESIITEPLQAGAAAKLAEIEAGKPLPPAVAEKPKIEPKFLCELQQLGDVVEGQSAHLEARFEPNDVQIKWMHDGTPVSASSRIKLLGDFGFAILEITSVEVRDSGEWSCEIKNQHGLAVSSGSLHCVAKANVILEAQQPKSLAKIQDLERPKAALEAEAAKPAPAPKFVAQLSQVLELEEGESVHLEAKVTPKNDPNMIVNWYHKGQILAYGHRYKLVNDFGFCILDILYLQPQDAGEFVCKATNLSGCDETKTVVKCKAKPGLLLGPQNEAKANAVSKLEDAMKRAQLQKLSTEKHQKMAPTFVEPLRSPPALREGESALFSARLKPHDDPKLKVEWFANGRPLKTGSRVKAVCDFGFALLEISPVYAEDSGEYKCRISNDLGEASTTAQLSCQSKQSIVLESQLPQKMSGASKKLKQLEASKSAPEAGIEKVYGAPKFVRPLDSLLDLAAGEVAHFECEVEPNDPRMKIEWLKDGQPLFHSSRIKMVHDFGVVIMEIVPAEPHDLGVYVCSASNEAGRASTQCALNVTGASSISYDWQKKDPKHKQRIEAIEAYLHKPHEGFEMPEKEFEPPEITEELESLGDVCEGEPAVLQCRFQPVGDSTIQIEWQHNGHAIPYSNRIQTKTEFGFAMLEIAGVISADSGEYSCRISTSKGSAVTTGSLICRTKKETEVPKFSKPLPTELAEVQEGDTVHLECLVTPTNDPGLTIQWYFNDKLLPTGHRFKTVTEFGYISLDITSAYKEDAGIYTCKATNEKGEATTSTRFDVQTQPGLVFERQAPKQNKADLERHLRQYTKAAIVLTEADFYEDSKKQKPTFRTKLANAVVNEGEFARFDCQVAPVQDPKMVVEWFLNGKPILLGHRFKTMLDYGLAALDILYALPDDSGEYTAVATNAYGTAKAKAKLMCATKRKVNTSSQMPQGLSVAALKDEQTPYWSEQSEDLPKTRSAPVFTIVPRSVQVKEGETARFEIALTGHPKPRVQWFVNGREALDGQNYKLHYDGMHYLIIPHVKPFDAGEVLVVAKNSEGESQASTTLDVFLTFDFRKHLLKSAPKAAEGVQEEREATWKRQAMGSLGDVFEQVGRPDLQKLLRIESQRNQPSMLESNELAEKFQRIRDEEHLDKLLNVEQQKQSMSSLQLEPVRLKPAKVIKFEQPKEESLPKVDLKPVPKAPMAPKPPETGAALDSSFIRPTLKKPSADELQAGKLRLKPAPEKEVDVPAKDQVTLKPTKSKATEELTREAEKTEKIELLTKLAAKKQSEAVQPKKKKASSKLESTGPQLVLMNRAYDGPLPTGDQSRAEQQKVANQIKSAVKRQQQAPPSRRSPRAPAPEIYVQLESVEARVGDAAKFYVEFSATPPGRLVWLKDDELIDQSEDIEIETTFNSSLLSIGRVREEDEGKYCFLLEDSGGAAESTANLAILKAAKGKQTTKKAPAAATLKEPAVQKTRAEEPPKIPPPQVLAQVEPCTVNLGETAKFFCEFAGTPPGQVVWLRDGKLVEQSDDISIDTTFESSMLTINNVKATNAGTYCFLLKDAGGSVKSAADLIIAKPVTVAAKHKAKEPSKPAPPQQPQQQPVAAPVAPAAAAKPKAQKAAPPPPEPIVVAPEIVEALQSATISDGQPAYFQAKLKPNNEPPNCQWYHDAKPIQANNGTEISLAGDVCTLKISNSTKANEGEYKLVVSNKAGKAESTAGLTIITSRSMAATSTFAAPSATATSTDAKKPTKEAPAFVKPVSNVAVTLDGTAKFHAIVTGVPRPTVAWFFKNQVLRQSPVVKISYNQTDCVLEILRLEANRVGTYMCKASNPSGKAECSAELSLSG